MNCPICRQPFKVSHVCEGFVYPPQNAIPKPSYHCCDEEIASLRSALAEKEKECERLKRVLEKISITQMGYACRTLAAQALEGEKK
jgi:predicted RNase H-like nuclease (RuvC/YqgF family)